MFVLTKANVKLANRSTLHTQGTGIILCRFTNCPIIYTVGPVYYFPDHHFNTISSGVLKYYVAFQKVTSKPIGNLGPIISQSTTWMAGFRFYPNSDT